MERSKEFLEHLEHQGKLDYIDKGYIRASLKQAFLAGNVEDYATLEKIQEDLFNFLNK